MVSRWDGMGNVLLACCNNFTLCSQDTNHPLRALISEIFDETKSWLGQAQELAPLKCVIVIYIQPLSVIETHFHA